MDNLPVADGSPSWKAPDFLSFKANCDMAVKPNHSVGTVAVVLRDWKGNVVDGRAKSSRFFSSLQGELDAIRVACLMISTLGLLGGHG